MRLVALFSAAMLVTIVMTTGEARAADADDQKALRIQRMLRQVSQERDTLQAENTKLKNEIEELNRKHAGIKKGADNALAKSRESISALNVEIQQAAQNQSRVESEKNLLQAKVESQTKQIESCESLNARLLQVNQEILAQYEKKGFFDSLMQREPITQLKSVEMENIVQDYQDRLDRLAVKKQESRTIPY
jgi:chromosome segregation ATPase